ncbi:MAG: hypothetical protein JJD98_10790 [Polaromonas sp.]|nr:hypothetical protein [Polaromonas sp.]
MNKRIYNVLAVLMLALFFSPFILKLREFDLLVVLIGGLLLPVYDLIKNWDEK